LLGAPGNEGGDVPSRPSTTDTAQWEAAAGGIFVTHKPVKRLLLTSFKPDGTAVATAVRVALDGDRACFRTRGSSGMSKRLSRNGWVQVAPCSALGFVRCGPPVGATARLLAGEPAGRVAGLLARERPAWHGTLGSLVRRVTRWQTVYYELRAGSTGPGA
jgi:PPOX class probable F420-dependent enzyme